jgi:hypothetical protein
MSGISFEFITNSNPRSNTVVFTEIKYEDCRTMMQKLQR